MNLWNVKSLWLVNKVKRLNEPSHDKTNIMHLPTAWIQTNLRIRETGSKQLLTNALCWFCHGAAQILLKHEILLKPVREMW
jgi:hypothetical protein